MTAPICIQVFGVETAYGVCASELDDEGFLDTLQDAEEYIDTNWLGEATEVLSTCRQPICRKPNLSIADKPEIKDLHRNYAADCVWITARQR